jgi:antitoxin (DNA-binding transcriptional repressor) of toxin-antitoxin stability system
MIFMTRITATDAVRSFSDLLNRAVYRQESFEVERGGQVVALLVPAPAARSGTLRALFEALRASGATHDPEFADAVELARGLGAEEPRNPWER